MPTLKELTGRSSKATCGIMEREVMVKTPNVPKAIKTLRQGGFYVVGKSLDKGATRQKVWFIRRGGF